MMYNELALPFLTSASSVICHSPWLFGSRCAIRAKTPNYIVDLGIPTPDLTPKTVGRPEDIVTY